MAISTYHNIANRSLDLRESVERRMNIGRDVLTQSLPADDKLKETLEKTPGAGLWEIGKNLYKSAYSENEAGAKGANRAFLTGAASVVLVPVAAAAVGLGAGVALAAASAGTIAYCLGSAFSHMHQAQASCDQLQQLGQTATNLEDGAQKKLGDGTIVDTRSNLYGQDMLTGYTVEDAATGKALSAHYDFHGKQPVSLDVNFSRPGAWDGEVKLTTPEGSGTVHGSVQETHGYAGSLLDITQGKTALRLHTDGSASVDNFVDYVYPKNYDFDGHDALGYYEQTRPQAFGLDGAWFDHLING